MNLFGSEWFDSAEGVPDVDDFKINGKCRVTEVLAAELYRMN